MLSVVALASILVLAGCNTKNTSSSSAVSSSSPKISSSTTTTVAVTGVTLDKTTAELVVGGTVTLTATVAPTTATDKTVTWASSDATVASVAAGVVTAVKAGTANITATCGTQVATCVVTVKAAMPTPTVTTIAALNALTADDTTHLYEVTGILEDKSATDKYGNGYLTDATTGASIKIYGSTTTASAITFTDNALGFTNPKDAVTTLADYANGESVTLHCVYNYYYSSTPEIMGIMTAHAATTNKYSITKETATNGTFTVDKETATYGETVTITTTPSSGYSVDTVKVNHNYANESATTVTADSSYTFTVTCVNSITVTFKAAETNSLILTSSNIISTQNAYGDYDSTVGGVTIKAMGCADYGNGIQMRYKNSVASAVYNTSATPNAIKNIVFTFGKSQSATAELTYVAFGAASLADTTTGATVTYDGTEHTYTITPDAATYTFFKFGHTTTSGAAYFESVVINYVTA